MPAKILSVSDRTIRDWLSRIDKDAKEARDRRVFEMWLACYTQKEIADKEGEPQRTISDFTATFSEIGNLAESAKATSSHATDFDAPIYNIWKQQEKTAGSCVRQLKAIGAGDLDGEQGRSNHDARFLGVLRHGSVTRRGR